MKVLLDFTFDHFIAITIAWSGHILVTTRTAKFCSRWNEDDKKLPCHIAAPSARGPVQAWGPGQGPTSLMPKASSHREIRCNTLKPKKRNFSTMLLLWFQTEAPLRTHLLENSSLCLSTYRRISIDLVEF